MKLPVTGRAASVQNMPAKSTIVEIGVHKGDFSARILKNARPKKLILIDPWKYFESDEYSQSHYGGGRQSQSQMDERYEGVLRRFGHEIEAGLVEVKRSFSYDAANAFSDEEIDCVYIDGDHSYEGVKRDIDAFFPKVRRGGLIFGDDYVLGQWWRDGVCRAFHERLAEGECIIHFKIDDQICLKKL